jgi:LDH2 family malate/lactate/ureidoglycolate dehydrogenase
VNAAGSDLRRLAAALLRSRRVRDDVAGPVVTSLVETSLRGVDSHGIELLPHYVRALDAGRINPDPHYRFERTAAATSRLDADHTFGHAAGAEAMRQAMTMAREAGSGAVAVANSTHFGAAAFFALLAAREGFLALSFTHADSLTLTHGGTRPFFGTNPVCFAAPCRDEEPFCLDMATSQVSWNKILRHRQSGEPLGDDWAFDAEARPARDAEAARMLAPIGAYKGYGLAMMVEILCGVLTGMPFGRDIVRMYADPIETKRRLGHFFMAIDPGRFLDPALFRVRLQELIDRVRAEPAADPAQPVMVPGDPEKKTFAVRTAEGVPLSPRAAEEFRALAAEIGEPWL